MHANEVCQVTCKHDDSLQLMKNSVKTANGISNNNYKVVMFSQLFGPGRVSGASLSPCSILVMFLITYRNGPVIDQMQLQIIFCLLRPYETRRMLRLQFNRFPAGPSIPTNGFTVRLRWKEGPEFDTNQHADHSRPIEMIQCRRRTSIIILIFLRFLIKAA